MGKDLHGSATTTETVRRAIQHSQESLRALARRYGINQKTVAKWKRRRSVSDLRTGPKEPKSTVLSVDEEAIVIAFRKHTLLPLDDCLYALRPTIPHLTRSSLHRCLQRHGIGRLPSVDGDKPAKKAFKPYPIGFFHIDIAEVPTTEGKLYLFVAIDRTSKFAFVQLVGKANRVTASAFLATLVAAMSYKTSHRPHRQRHPVPASTALRRWPNRAVHGADVRHVLPREWHRTPLHQDQLSLDQQSGSTHEPHHRKAGSATPPGR